MRFVIGGTGRSGTKWCATVLRNAGIYCGHEQVYTTDLLASGNPPRWGDFEGDSSLAAVPWFGGLGVRWVLVVRHPLDVAGSFLRVGPFKAGSQPEGLTAYIAVYHPVVLNEESELEAALRYWLIWNRLALDSCDIWARLEDLEPRDLLRLADVRPRWHPFPIGQINRGSDGDRPEWPNNPQLVEKCVDLARKLGYSC